MTDYNVLSKIYIDGNTAIVAEGPRSVLKAGIEILDEMGEKFKVLSIGMDKPIDAKIINENEWHNRASLLIAGIFTSNKFSISN